MTPAFIRAPFVQSAWPCALNTLGSQSFRVQHTRALAGDLVRWCFNLIGCQTEELIELEATFTSVVPRLEPLML